jgi:hypothetical protein
MILLVVGELSGEQTTITGNFKMKINYRLRVGFGMEWVWI